MAYSDYGGFAYRNTDGCSNGRTAWSHPPTGSTIVRADGSTWRVDFITADYDTDLRAQIVRAP